jgi:DHA1 family multidrug resistance protein-like MFS transporter
LDISGKTGQNLFGKDLLALYLSIFVAVLGFSLVSPILPVYVVDLGASYVLLGVIISTYGAVQLITQVPMGILSDRIGRRPLILLGLFIFAILAPLYVYAGDARLFIILRAFAGLAGSCVWPLAMALVIDRVAVPQRGSAMGWFNASFYFALAIGPAIGGGLYDLFGLKAPFYFWSALLMASLLIVLTFVKEPDRPAKVEKRNNPSRKEESLILDGYRTTFVACCGAVMWIGLIMGFNMTLLPNFAGNLGFSSTEIGFLYLAFAGTTAISNVYFGYVSDKGWRRLLIVGGAVSGAVSFLLLAGVSSPYPFFLVMAVMGFGSGMSNPASSATIADITVSSRRGEIFGIFNTARMMGVVIGPLIAGLTAEFFGIHGSILSFFVIALIATIVSLFIREPPVPKAI